MTRGSVCVVTGASSGIGRALALSLARGGARVWAIGRALESLDTLARDVGSGGSVTPLVADLEDDEDIERAAASVLEGERRIDVLVHSAGTIAPGALDSVPVLEFDRMHAVNLRGPFVLTRALLPALRAAKGQIVFVNSSAALRASASNVLYAVTKAGLKAFADGLRDEVNRDGLRVVTVYAGRTATPMQALVHEHEAKPYRPELLLQPEDVVEVVLSTLELPRTGEVTDVMVRPMSKPPETTR
jgi:NADP-dependent 3-hydroxy acid dehydrogenase YdfG